jgi:hypothetical protein
MSKYSGVGPFDMAKEQVTNFRVHNVTNAERTTLGLTLNIGHSGINVWDVEDELSYYWNGSAWVTWAGGSAYTDLQAQNAVGSIMQNSNTVQLVYNSGAHTITANARLQMSVTSDSGGIKLSGDAASPGNTKYYGTDGAGAKGWHSFPSSLSSYSFQWSIAQTSPNIVRLTNDVDIPGLVKYYGTNGSGTKGWFALPNGGKNFLFPQSVFENSGTVTLKGDQANPGNVKYYGTNGAGIKGWYSLPAAISSLTFQYSIVEHTGLVNLVNDVAAPGNLKYYGTNLSGLKGWHDLLVFAKVTEVKMTVGDPDAWPAGETTFILRDCNGDPVVNKKLIFFKERNKMIDKNARDFSYDNTTGEVTATLAMRTGQDLEFYAYEPEIFTECQTVTEINVNDSFPYTIPIILN